LDDAGDVDDGDEHPGDHALIEQKLAHKLRLSINLIACIYRICFIPFF
jgi:hypothetical protein